MVLLNTAAENVNEKLQKDVDVGALKKRYYPQ